MDFYSLVSKVRIFKYYRIYFRMETNRTKWKSFSKGFPIRRLKRFLLESSSSFWRVSAAWPSGHLPPAACRLPLSLSSCSITRESRVQLVWEKKTKKRGTFSSLIQLKNFPNWCRIVTIRKPDYKTPRSQTTQISFLLRGTLHGAFPISVSKSAWGNPISRGANREREGERADFHGRRRRWQGS